MSEFYQNKNTVDEYIRLAEGHNGSALIQRLKKYLAKGSTLLELGTGPGTDWELLREDYRVTGSDFSQEFLKRLKKREPAAELLQLDASTLETDRTFDGIYSNKVLHHLTDEELANSMQRQWEMLNPAGVICHSFWKGEGTEVFKGLFVNYHLESQLSTFLVNRFEILELKAYQEFESGDSILLIARKR